PPSLCTFIDRVLVTRHEAIERRVESNQRSFVGSNRARQVARVGGMPEHAAEEPIIVRDTANSSDCGIEAALTHLDRMDYWQLRLLLEAGGAAIPELGLIVQGVQNCGCITLAREAMDPERGRLSIGERARRIMTCGASDRSIGRQPAVEEQFLAQFNLF